MEDDVREVVEKLLSFAPPERVDSFARKNLDSAIINNLGDAVFRLGDVEYIVDGKRYGSLLAAMAEREIFEELTVVFNNLRFEPVWRYDLPVRKIKFYSDGRGGMLYFPKKMVMGRYVIDPSSGLLHGKIMTMIGTERWFIPEDIKTATERPQDVPPARPPGLLPPADFWREVRRGTFIPFRVTFYVYARDARYRFIVDLLRNLWIKDFREGRFDRVTVNRSPLDSLYLDRVVASNVLKDVQKKILIYAFDVEDCSPSEIAYGLGITEAMARNHLQALLARNLMTVEGSPPNETYKINLEFLRETKGEVME